MLHLSVLTAIVSLLSVFIVPLIVFNSAEFLGIEIIKEISMLNIALKMINNMPVILGMIVRSLMTNFIISKTLIIQRLSSNFIFNCFYSYLGRKMGSNSKFYSRAGFVLSF